MAKNKIIVILIKFCDIVAVGFLKHKKYRRNIMKQAFKFLISVCLTIIIIGGLVFGLLYLNSQFHFFDAQAEVVQKQFGSIQDMLFRKLTAGLTVGSIIFILLLFILPLFLKGVHTKEYIKNIILGLISSGCFFVCQTVYLYFANQGTQTLIIAVACLIIVILIIIEFFALLIPFSDKGYEFRTLILAGIASGAIFAITLNTVTTLLNSF